MSGVDDDEIEAELRFAGVLSNYDTSFEEFRNGKDIQGIPWESLNLNREKTRLDRYNLYKNLASIGNSGKDAEKHTSLSPDGKHLVVVGDSQDGLLVDWQSGETVKTFRGHLDYSFSYAWHPDGQTFATGSQDKTCRVWDTWNLSKSVTVLNKGNIGGITSDGQLMAMTENADFAHIYDVKCKYEKELKIDFMGETAGISFSPDTESLQFRRRWNILQDFQLSDHSGFPWPVNHTSLSPYGKPLVIVGDTQDGKLVDSQSGQHTSLSPDGKLLVVVGDRQDGLLVNWQSGETVGTSQSIHFTSDGKFMAVADPEDYVRIYDVNNGQMEELLEQRPSFHIRPPYFPIRPYQPPIFQPYHYPVFYSTLVGPTCPPIYYYPPPQMYPRVPYIQPLLLIPGTQVLTNGALSPYYILCFQWGRTTRIHHVQPFMDAPMRITIHGLWEKNFSGGIYGGVAFDPTLGGDNLLVARANLNWPNVLLNMNPHDILTHNMKLWRGEWVTHGLHCPLTQDQYMRTTLDKFDETTARLHEMLNRCCSEPIDPFGRRLMCVSQFLSELAAAENAPKRNGIPILPSIHVRPNPWFGEDLHEIRYYLDAALNFLPAMGLSNCTLDLIEVP